MGTARPVSSTTFESLEAERRQARIAGDAKIRRFRNGLQLARVTALAYRKFTGAR